MKTHLLLIALVSLSTSLITPFTCRAQNIEDIAPTGLTVVVCDSSDSVLDTVIVAKDQQSGSIFFSLPADSDEIRVFALGDRVTNELPSNLFIKGRPKDSKWMGLGYIEVHIENGRLVAIDGNGMGQFKLTDSLKTQIQKDIEAGVTSTITKVELQE